MGNVASCETDEISCSSAFATCRTQHCTSSCMKRAKAIETAAEPLEIIARDVLRKFIEDNLHMILKDHLPAALASHFESVADNMIDIIVTPPSFRSPVQSPTQSPTQSPDPPLLNAVEPNAE